MAVTGRLPEVVVPVVALCFSMAVLLTDGARRFVSGPFRGRLEPERCPGGNIRRCKVLWDGLYVSQASAKLPA